MTRRYLYVMDPLDSIDHHTDTTYYLMQESHLRGALNYVCHVDDLLFQNAMAFCSARKLNAQFEPGKPCQLALNDFDVIWMRKDPPIDESYLNACMLLDCVDERHTLVVNRPSSLRIANEKLWPLSFAQSLMPRTVVSSHITVLLDAAATMNKVVLKPIGGKAGFGIMVFASNDPNLPAAIELLSNEGRRAIIVQEYLPQVSAGDKRIILLGGKPIGALLRVPQGQDHRANLHAGGRAQKTTISERDREISAFLAPKLMELGLLFVGIDVIGDYLTEVNVTSPTGAQQIDRLEEREGKSRIPAQVFDYIERMIA